MVERFFCLATILFLYAKLNSQTYEGFVKPAHQLEFANYLYSTFTFDKNGYSIELSCAEFLERINKSHTVFHVDSSLHISYILNACHVNKNYYEPLCPKYTIICFYSSLKYYSFHKKRIKLLIEACKDKNIKLLFIAQEFKTGPFGLGKGGL